MNMTIEELYNKLEDKSFQDMTTGSLFYNVYIYQYPAQDEYEIQGQIEALKVRLKRPNNNLDILTLNIFDEFCAFLDQKSFGKNPSLLKYLLYRESHDPGYSAFKTLSNKACQNEDDTDNFYKWINSKIIEHQNLKNNLGKSFVFMNGFGQIFPYLRTNTFLSNFERYNSGESYKIIVFYPGHAEGNSFSLFDVLTDAHTYRSIKLINE